MNLFCRIGLSALVCCLIANASEAANGRRPVSGVAGTFGSTHSRGSTRTNNSQSRSGRTVGRGPVRSGIGTGVSGRGIGTGLSGAGVGMGRTGTGFGAGVNGQGLSGKGIGMGASGNGMGTGISGRGVGMGRSGTGIGGTSIVPRRNARSSNQQGRHVNPTMVPR